VGEEPINLTARKPGPLYIPSILSGPGHCRNTGISISPFDLLKALEILMHSEHALNVLILQIATN
jgi:hypothetical protein